MPAPAASGTLSLMPRLTLRERRPADLPVQWHWEHEQPQPEWKLWDAPYLHEAEPPSSLSLEEYTAKANLKDPNRQVIALDGECIGTVSRHAEAPAGSGWWELGLLIYDPGHWGGGYGQRALRLWTAQTFAETSAHLITLTTWSGNERMVRAAQRVGYRECARIPEARRWAGRRWDSVRLGTLRREWENAGHDPAPAPAHSPRPDL